MVAIGPLTAPADSGASQKFKGGLYYAVPVGSNQTAAAMSNGNLQLVPVTFDETTTIDRLAVSVTGAGTTGALVRLGIYDDDGNGYPGALVLDAGTVDVTTTGVKEKTISQELAAGTYWIGAVCQGTPATPPTVRCVNTSSASDVPIGSSTASTADANSANGYRQTGVTGALPALFSTTDALQASPVRPLIRVV